MKPRRRPRAGVLPFCAAALLIAVSSCRSITPDGALPDDPVGRALYDAHCAACHGPTGLGDGAAAVALPVRPRNFRDEEIRYVSAPGGPPTEGDLIQTIRRGRVLGGMPAFPYLTHDESRALADFVRGFRRIGVAAELRLQLAGDEELEPGEIDEIAAERVEPGEPVEIKAPGPGFRADSKVAGKLYAENCASCHGPTGRGDGLDLPLDERGQPVEVRDLTTGVFRGGTRPSEIFKRIRCGVPGTPMPSADALDDEQVWQLVRYVDSLAGLR
jgi:mono/diheme cytochrome c family protein